MNSKGKLVGRLAMPAAMICALAATGCMARVGVQGVKVPADAAQQCERHCQTIGLNLSAVAIMANNVGCVCQAGAPDAKSGAMQQHTSATVGGMTAILLQQEQQEQAREHSQTY